MQQIFATREFLKTPIQQVHVKGRSRGGAPGGPHPSYFYIKLKNEKKTEKTEKNSFETAPRYLRVWMTTPPYLKVWICHYMYVFFS